LKKWMRGLLEISLFGIELATTIAALSAQPQGQTAPALNEPLRKELADYLVAHFQSPEDYVVAKFKDHDLIFIGEAAHGVRQNLLFLHQLIPRLYKAGVHNIGYEMIFSDEQSEVDKLLNADKYDETKALTLLFHWDAQIGFAYQEYADVLRAVWTLNHGLPSGAPRFRIVGTDLRPDWSLVKPGDNVTSRSTRWKAWAGSNQVARNVWMNAVIRREFIDKGLKALIYTGAGHTPLYVQRDEREETGLRFSVAYQISRRLGNRATSVVILSGANQNPTIAEIMAAAPAKYQVLGFDLKGTPVGALPLPERVAATIVTEKKNLTFADYMDGVVFLAFTPEPVTMAPGFITDVRVEQAKREGWLPAIPEITVQWIMQRADQFKKSVLPAVTPQRSQ
jgi:hypothetical protein